LTLKIPDYAYLLLLGGVSNKQNPKEKGQFKHGLNKIGSKNFILRLNIFLVVDLNMKLRFVFKILI